MVFIKHALKSYPTNVIFLSVRIYVNDFISAVGTQSKCSEVRYQSKKRKSFLLLRLIYSGSVVLIQFTLLIISRLKLNNFSTFWSIKIWIRLLLSGEYTSLLCNLDFKMHRFFLLLYIYLMNPYPLVLNPCSMLYGYFYRYRLMSIHVDENPQPENIAHKFFTLINWSLIPTAI